MPNEVCTAKLLRLWHMIGILPYENVSSQVSWWPPPSTQWILTLLYPTGILEPWISHFYIQVLTASYIDKSFLSTLTLPHERDLKVSEELLSKILTLGEEASWINTACFNQTFVELAFSSPLWVNKIPLCICPIFLFWLFSDHLMNI